MFWVLVLGFGVMGLVWWRSVRRVRENWLHDLSLVGKWELEASDAKERGKAQRSLTLSGGLASGRYVARDGDDVHRGKWRLSGHTLALEPLESEAGNHPGAAQFELRLFEPGRIGLDGPGRERETYRKREGNVIPLAKRPRRRG